MFELVLVHHHLVCEPAKDLRFSFIFEGDNKPYIGQVVICNTKLGETLGEIAEIYGAEEALWVINNRNRSSLKTCRPAPEWATALVRKFQYVNGKYLAYKDKVENPNFDVPGRLRPVGYQPHPVEEGYRQPHH